MDTEEGLIAKVTLHALRSATAGVPSSLYCCFIYFSARSGLYVYYCGYDV